MGKVFLISSPDYPKKFLGKTIVEPNSRAKFYGKCQNSPAKPIIDTANYEVTILYDGDDYVKQFEDLLNSFDKGQLINLPQKAKNTYARKYYHEVIKPNRSESYYQLNKYYANKEAILRHTALKNIQNYARRPLEKTIERYKLTEQEIYDALQKAT